MKNQNEGSPTVSGHYPCHWKEVRVADSLTCVCSLPVSVSNPCPSARHACPARCILPLVLLYQEGRRSGLRGRIASPMPTLTTELHPLPTFPSTLPTCAACSAFLRWVIAPCWVRRPSRARSSSPLLARHFPTVE